MAAIWNLWVLFTGSRAAVVISLLKENEWTQTHLSLQLCNKTTSWLSCAGQETQHFPALKPCSLRLISPLSWLKSALLLSALSPALLQLSHTWSSPSADLHLRANQMCFITWFFVFFFFVWLNLPKHGPSSYKRAGFILWILLWDRDSFHVACEENLQGG